MLKKILISLAMCVIFFLPVELLRHKWLSDNFNPCLVCGSKGISIVYISGKHSSKKTDSRGCALCDAENYEQWNTMYGIYGGRDYIEFIVIFPEKLSNYKGFDMRYDLNVIMNVKAAAKQDIVIICKRGEKLYEKSGPMDMAFIRKVSAMLNAPHLE